MLVLSLPSIVGTGFFLAAVLIDPWLGAPGDPWKEPGPARQVLYWIVIAMYFACMFGAMVGPVFLPLAAERAFKLTRAAGLRAPLAVWGWILVLVGVCAAVTWWRWLMHLDIYI